MPVLPTTPANTDPVFLYDTSLFIDDMAAEEVWRDIRRRSAINNAIPADRRSWLAEQFNMDTLLSMPFPNPPDPNKVDPKSCMSLRSMQSFDGRLPGVDNKRIPTLTRFASSSLLRRPSLMEFSKMGSFTPHPSSMEAWSKTTILPSKLETEVVPEEASGILGDSDLGEEGAHADEMLDNSSMPISAVGNDRNTKRPKSMPTKAK